MVKSTEIKDMYDVFESLLKEWNEVREGERERVRERLNQSCKPLPHFNAAIT